MHQFALVTDSTADETAEYFEKNDIKYASLSFTIDGRTIEEDCGQVVSFPAFYNLLREGKTATTSQPTLDSFLAIFRPLLEAGKDILYIGFSSGLSSTFSTGCIARDELAAEFPDRKIICVDTVSATGGEYILVDRAREMRDSGCSIETTAAAIEEIRERVIHLIVVNDLEHLHRGGRVSKTSAVVGGLLGIKPIIYVNKEGKLVVCDKVRGRQKSIETIGNRLIAEIANKNDMVRICHGDCEEDAQYLADYIMQKAGIRSDLRYVGTVIGSHTGPGVIALCYIGSERVM